MRNSIARSCCGLSSFWPSFFRGHWIVSLYSSTLCAEVRKSSPWFSLERYDEFFHLILLHVPLPFIVLSLFSFVKVNVNLRLTTYTAIAFQQAECNIAKVPVIPRAYRTKRSSCWKPPAMLPWTSRDSLSVARHRLPQNKIVQSLRVFMNANHV